MIEKVTKHVLSHVEIVKFRGLPHRAKMTHFTTRENCKMFNDGMENLRVKRRKSIFENRPVQSPMWNKKSLKLGKHDNFEEK